MAVPLAVGVGSLFGRPVVDAATVVASGARWLLSLGVLFRAAHWIWRRRAAWLGTSPAWADDE